MEKYINVLKNTKLFYGIDNNDLILLLNCLSFTRRDYKKDEYVFTQGSEIKFAGVVLSGSICLLQEDVWGRRNIIANLKPGDVFGESVSVTGGKNPNISAYALENTEILFLNIEKIIRVCPNSCAFHTRLIGNLVNVLAEKTVIMNEKLTHMSKKSTKEKLLSYLSQAAVKSGSNKFTIPFNRQELADYLCVERAAMCAELSKLKKKGIIAYNKSNFEILKNCF